MTSNISTSNIVSIFANSVAILLPSKEIMKSVMKPDLRFVPFFEKTVKANLQISTQR